MKKSSKKWIIGITLVVLVALVFSFFAGFIKVSKQTVYGSSSTSADALSYARDNLCNEGYKCFAPKINSLTGKYGVDCYLSAGTVPASQDICSTASMVSSHARYSCSSGSIYWFDSTGKKEELKQTCSSSGCVDTSLTASKCNAVVVTATYGQTYCASTFKTNCPNGCDLNGKCVSDTTKCISGYALKEGVCTQVYGATACKSLYSLDCPNGCFISATSCADGTLGKDVPPVVVVDTPVVISDNSQASLDVATFDCTSVDCSNYCDSSGTYFSDGSCKADLGGCVYNSVSGGSTFCQGGGAGSTCLIYPSKDGTSCGVNKVWASSTDSKGCYVYDCTVLGSSIDVVVPEGIPAIFYWIVGSLIVVVLIVVIVVMARKKGKK